MPGGLFSQNASWNGEGWFLVEGSHDCYQAAFRLAVFSMFPIPEELDRGWRGRCIGCDLSSQVLEVFLFVLVLSLSGSSFECRDCMYEEGDA